MGGWAVLRAETSGVLAVTTPESFFLQPDELQALTGFKLPGRQCRWLSEGGWRFIISGSGRPVVARTYAEKMLGCRDIAPANDNPTPNFGALLRAV